jgi:hypothetical protein
MMAAPETQGGSSAETNLFGRRQRNALREQEFQGWDTSALQAELEDSGVPFEDGDSKQTLIDRLVGRPAAAKEEPKAAE